MGVMSLMGWRYLTRGDKRNIVQGIEDGVAYGGPYHVELHPADRCNIECFFCSTASIRGTDEFPLTRVEELFLELKNAGTRSIRLSGGGEPLFHRKTKDYLRTIAASGIPIEDLTTNGVLLTEEIVDLLIAARCEEVMVSLNTADPQTYATMMQTPERNYDRVVQNIRALTLRKGHPRVTIQFLVWKGNYTTIPAMYRLARGLGVKSLFNGLSYLPPAQHMTPEETSHMLRLYEDVIREDEFRTITSISSYEQNLTQPISEITTKLHEERRAEGRVKHWQRVLARRDFSLREKIQHKWRMRAIRKTNAMMTPSESCIVGWYSLVIRTSGIVAPCCILQGHPIGNIFKESLHDVWHGDGFQQLRRELSNIMRRPNDWAHDPAIDQHVQPGCGGKTTNCPIRNFYYNGDPPFVRAFLGSLQRMPDSAAVAAVRP